MTTRIGIILGTPRQPSLGSHLFHYLQRTFSNTDKVTFTWLALRDYPLPFYDHEETPLETPIQDLSTPEQAWLDQLAAQDGYIIISPEYDHAIPGILKNALDFVGPEVDHKPVQIITYSHYSDGGMLAAESMVEILQILKMIVYQHPSFSGTRTIISLTKEPCLPMQPTVPTLLSDCRKPLQTSSFTVSCSKPILTRQLNKRTIWMANQD